MLTDGSPRWAFSGRETSRTALSQAELCSGQRWVKLSKIRDSAESSVSRKVLSCGRYKAESSYALFSICAESSRALSGTGWALSWTVKHCRNTAESGWALSWTAQSQAEHHLGQRLINWALPKTALTQPDRCPVNQHGVKSELYSRQRGVKLTTDRDSAVLDTVLIIKNKKQNKKQ